MSLANPCPPTCSAEIWGRFLEALSGQRIKQKQWRWYAYRVERYLRTISSKPPEQHVREDVVGYLEALGVNGGLEDWQYAQVVEALQILFSRAVRPSGAKEMDWGHWKDSARRLGPRHPTVARESEPERAHGHGPETSPLDRIRIDHRDVVTALIAEIRRRGYSIRTEQVYEQWVCRYIAFCSSQAPRELGGAEVKSFLENLAVQRKVAANTQNQALNALVFFYKQVLGRPLDGLDSLVRAKRPRRLSVVLTRGEARALLQQMEGIQRLMASLLYGTGMRLMECVRLRIQDIDFGYRQIVVRDAKGAKDRVVPLPQVLAVDIREHLKKVRETFQADIERGLGEVFFPEALARKYPSAPRERRWQYVFPSARPVG